MKCKKILVHPWWNLNLKHVTILFEESCIVWPYTIWLLLFERNWWIIFLTIRFHHILTLYQLASYFYIRTLIKALQVCCQKHSCHFFWRHFMWNCFVHSERSLIGSFKCSFFELSPIIMYYIFHFEALNSHWSILLFPLLSIRVYNTNNELICDRPYHMFDHVSAGFFEY